jgi:hypothetical protein
MHEGSHAMMSPDLHYVVQEMVAWAQAMVFADQLSEKMRAEYAGHYDDFLQDPRGFVQRVCQGVARDLGSGAEHCR